MPQQLRWVVQIFHSTPRGPVVDTFHIEELSELQAIVERGPDWRQLDHIEIRYAWPDEAA